MLNNYIARFPDGKLISIYYTGGALKFRTWENGRWLSENIFLEDALPDFTVNFSIKNELRIFAQKSNGCIVLVSFDGETITQRIILENKSGEVHTILFHSLESENLMSLVYNIPCEDNKQKLMLQTLNENGIWGEAREIGRFSGFAGQLFELQRITPAHALAFYRSESNIVGYKEITPEKASEFVPIQRYAENMQSFSFLTSKNGLHTLYIAGGIFSSKLMYRRKVTGIFDAPITLWEGQGLENCLLAQIEAILYVLFQVNGTLYMLKSFDGGVSFARPEIYRHKFCRSPLTAGYICARDNENYFLNNLFVDGQCPWDIQIFPEMCDNFFVYSYEKENISPRPEKPSTPAAPEPKELIVNEDTARMELMMERMERLSAENRDYRGKIAELVNKLAESENKLLQLDAAGEKIKDKDKLLDSLNKKLVKLQNDINKQKSSNSNYIKKIKKLEKENASLKKSNNITKNLEPEPEKSESDSSKSNIS